MRFICDKKIKPRRSTRGSAGYDFFAPEDIEVPPKHKVMFDSGVVAELDEGTYMRLEDRSSLAFAGIKLGNHGIIDSDYRDTIKVLLENQNFGDRPYVIKKGERYMQGIIGPYLTADDDDANVCRTGGIGSTGR